MTLRYRFVAYSIAVFGLLSSPSQSQSQTLVGKSIELSRTAGASLQDARIFAVQNVLVGPGLEATNYGASGTVLPPPGLPGFVDIDISATSIQLTLTSDHSFIVVDALRFHLNQIPPFVMGVAINPATKWGAFASEISRAQGFGRDVTVDLGQITGVQGQKIVLDLNLSNVPEPSGAALGALAVAALGALRRRRA